MKLLIKLLYAILLLLHTTKSSDAHSGTVTSAGKEERLTKSKTGDVCEGNPHHADPNNYHGHEWIKECSQCVEASQNSGKDCWANTWTLKTKCECENYLFMDCYCWRTPNVLFYITYLILPCSIGACMWIWRLCHTMPICPWKSTLQKADKWIAQQLENDADIMNPN